MGVIIMGVMEWADLLIFNLCYDSGDVCSGALKKSSDPSGEFVRFSDAHPER